jgi:hypothetical protein
MIGLCLDPWFGANGPFGCLRKPSLSRPAGAKVLAGTQDAYPWVAANCSLGAALGGLERGPVCLGGDGSCGLSSPHNNYQLGDLELAKVPCENDAAPIG